MDPTTSSVFNLPIGQSLSDASSMAGKAVNYADRHLYEDKYVERDGKHKGIGGAARGILGFLGDLLLTRLHMPAQFGPNEEKRKLAAASDGFNIDPESAINRVASIDPVYGQKLRENYTDNQRVAAQNAATNEARQARIDLMQADRDQKTRFYGASALNSMVDWPEDKRKANWPTMRNQIIVAGKKQGLDLSNELPEQYDPIQLDAFIDGAVPVGTQRAQRLSGERLGETIRHNTTTEGQTDEKIDETKRHNKTTEGLGQGRLGETIRHNTTTEGQTGEKIDETKRHNTTSEGLTKRGQDVRNPIRQQTINGVKYNFKLVGKDWVNMGPAK